MKHLIQKNSRLSAFFQIALTFSIPQLSIPRSKINDMHTYGFPMALWLFFISQLPKFPSEEELELTAALAYLVERGDVSVFIDDSDGEVKFQYNFPNMQLK